MSSALPLLNEDPEPANDADPVIVINGPPPGVRRFAVYCDESGTGGSSDSVVMSAASIGTCAGNVERSGLAYAAHRG